MDTKEQIKEEVNSGTVVISEANSAHSFTEGSDVVLEKEQLEEKKEQVPAAQSMEEILAQRQKEVEEFKADKANQDNALILAKDINTYTGGKWFTIPKLAKKTGLTEIMAFQKLKLLEMFNLCMFKKGDPMNPKERGQLVCKLILDQSHEIKAIDDTIAHLRGEIEGLELRKKVLQNIETVKEN